jgi:hypothetical protein
MPKVLLNQLFVLPVIAHKKSARLACAVPAASLEQCLHIWAMDVEILPAISARATLNGSFPVITRLQGWLVFKA